MKKNKRTIKTVMLMLFMVFAISTIITAYYAMTYIPPTDAYFKKNNQELPNELSTILKEQLKMDEKINDIIENGGYTFDDPCVLKNPYGINELSALIIFNTDYETEIIVSINDFILTTMSKGKTHVIPIYNLYANSLNTIGLKTNKKEYKEVEIKTNYYDDNIKDYKFDNYSNKEYLTILDPTNIDKKYLRAFDLNGNLVMYYDFGYLDSYYIDEDITVNYNSIFKGNSSIDGINIKMDFFGKIKNISKNNNTLNSNVDFYLNGDKYISQKINIYSEITENYDPPEYLSGFSDTLPKQITTKKIKEELKTSKPYLDDYKISVNNNILLFDFKNNESSLILVSKNSKYSYLYDLTDKKYIAIDRKGEYSLYLKYNNKYYNLLTTIKI